MWLPRVSLPHKSPKTPQISEQWPPAGKCPNAQGAPKNVPMTESPPARLYFWGGGLARQNLLIFVLFVLFCMTENSAPFVGPPRPWSQTHRGLGPSFDTINALMRQWELLKDADKVTVRARASGDLLRGLGGGRAARPLTFFF